MKSLLGKIWARRADVAALAFIGGFFLLFFGPVIFSGKFLVMLDAYAYSLPLRTVAWGMLRQGTLPLWTPLLMSGYPLLSMAQVGIAYPLTWGYLLFPGHVAEEIYLLGPFLLAPAFTYAYAREVGRSRLAALLAGLAFAYGGFTTNAMGMNGMPTNAVMWLPLLLLAIERARARRFVPCLLGATAAYSLTMLTGHGQSCLMVGLLALSYSVCLTAADILANCSQRNDRHTQRGWECWQPLLVAIGAIVLSAGVAAFQILETMRAVRRSIRGSLTYETFTQGSFTLLTAWKSLLAPPFYPVEVTAYVTPLALALALFAGVAAARRPAGRDVRVFFWLATAAAGWALMLGDNTPLYQILYHLPLFNLFRMPARHAFEWTFAIALLSAYGWDAFGALVRPRRDMAPGAKESKAIVIALLSFAAGVAVSCYWWKLTGRATFPIMPLTEGMAESVYLGWKLAAMICVLLLLWQAWRVPARTWRTGLLAAAIAWACFTESFILASCWWFPWAQPAGHFSATSPTVHWLQQYPPELHRVYIRVNLFVEEYSPVPSPLEEPNRTVPQGIQNVAGYEQLIFERYSRALGNLWVDGVNPRPGYEGAPGLALFAPQSHVLDLLNTVFVVSFTNLGTMPESVFKREGVGWAATADLAVAIAPGETATVRGLSAAGDTLALVSTLANSADVAHGATIARVRLFTEDGQVSERELRAGIDTAEWAHERADVRPTIRHALAPIFDSVTVRDERHGEFPSHRYWTRLPLAATVERLQRVEIRNETARASLSVWKATLFDAASGRSSALSDSSALAHLDGGRWQVESHRDGVMLLRNTRALSRVWLAPEAVAVDGEEALRRIRGEGVGPFNPRRTALLEVAESELPRLPGGELAAESGARLITYEPNRIVIETRADKAAVLVVSEINYPGWEATLDGAPVSVHQTNFLLRGIVVPAGQHRVEMRYTAPAARIGALLSLATLMLLAGLAAYARRSAKSRPAL